MRRVAQCTWSLLVAALLLVATIGEGRAFGLYDFAPVGEPGRPSVGLYGGALYTKPFVSFYYDPAHIHLVDDYIVALNFDYRFFRFGVLPLHLEGEFNVVKRFGKQDQVEVDIAPAVRWTWFPWNNYVYTNARIAIVGLSYASSISPYERQNSGNSIGSNVLHYLAPELTFARSETSSGEAFVRIHHRSGVFGLFNGVKGGSNYLSGGYRVFY